ncbi:unnamed protein product [Leptidea sinapis]|uniref:Uncharacterized protein n=1 Tax=Leptidea sinapis TaxID=189913 RepID=A0A5E4QWK7_9NEOP|nr:unnamed protein product [Leptidea sinapis]
MFRRSLKFNEMMFRHASNSKFNPYNVINVVNGCEYGDWLFLYYLAKNMKSVVFQDLFQKISEELEKRDMPTNDDNDDMEKGAEPILLGRVDYDDETLPLKDKTSFKTLE